jgi:hypothetical protein
MTATEDAKARRIKFNTDSAIQAFQTVEKSRLRLDEDEHQLERTLAMGVDMKRYYEQTADITAEFEHKREVAARVGKLPKDH